MKRTHLQISDSSTNSNNNANNNTASTSSNATRFPLTRQPRYRLPILGLNVTDNFPNQSVICETGNPGLLNSLTQSEKDEAPKIIRCMLNLSVPQQWEGEEGQANLAAWKGQAYAAGCTSRAAEMIKRYEEFEKLGYKIEIIACADLPEDQLAVIRKTQTDLYKTFYKEKNGKDLPADFVLPVTFAALTPKARDNFLARSYPSFKFKKQSQQVPVAYLNAQTFVLNEKKEITQVIKHGHVQPNSNTCQTEAEELLKTLQSNANRLTK